MTTASTLLEQPGRVLTTQCLNGPGHPQEERHGQARRRRGSDSRDQLPPDWPQGREGFKRLVQTWRVAFPDLHEHLEFVLAEGDRALGRFRLTGTHSGPFYGIEPTGRSVDIHGVDVARIVDGQIVEYFYHEDTFGLFRQLGRFPANYSDVAGTIQDASVNA